LSATALRMLKDRVGDRVEILCAGAAWNPREYGLDGVVTNLGLLQYRETAELYRSCHIGFVMMMTRHPSYLPFEFMACGGLLVSNDNPTNSWLLQHGYNCLLAPASAPAIAERLAYAIDSFEELDDVRRNGHELITCHHSDWDEAFAGVFGFIAALSSHERRRAA
jgi:glycosyltransferase involved in cell wall biosynthesis